MEKCHFLFIILAIIFGSFNYGLSDGLKDHGESCSLRSQVANYFREKDSPEGCISAKGLVCVNHKCSCADPSNVYEAVEPTSGSGITSSITSSASSFIKGLVNKAVSTSTVTPTATAVGGSSGINGGKCVGRSGSPCFTQNSTCVRHATCEGSLRICKCQGIYSSNAQGHCSKTAGVVSKVIKSTVG